MFFISFRYLLFLLNFLSSLQLQTCPLIVFTNVTIFYYRYFHHPSYNTHYPYKLNNIKNKLFSYNFFNYFYYFSSCTFQYTLFPLFFVGISRRSRFVLLLKLPHFLFFTIFPYLLFLSINVLAAAPDKRYYYILRIIY